MKQQEPLISVIVPVYNVEAYLERCLASIAAQTYSSREVILIDDASKDGSGSICDRWAALDGRWEVIHLPQNKGLSAARNEGICRARGQFITFIDSDDYVEPELLRKLYDALSESGAQVSVCGTDGLGTGEEPAHIYTRREAVYAMAGRSPFLWTAWGKLYPAALVKRYAFNSRSLCSEDLLFFYQILEEVVQISYVPDRLYHYAYRVGSLINDGIDEKRCTVLDVLDHICADAAVRFPGAVDGFRQMAMDTAVRLGMQAVEAGRAQKDLSGYLRRFQQHLRRHFSLGALRICPHGKGVAAQLLLYWSRTAFWCMAVAYKHIKPWKRGGNPYGKN